MKWRAGGPWEEPTGKQGSVRYIMPCKVRAITPFRQQRSVGP